MKDLHFRTLRADEIDCRIGTITDNGLTLLLYKDARADMNLLDEVVGPMRWRRTHFEVKGNLYCEVSLYDEDTKQWIGKCDCGTESYTEKEKGEASDSFKRACTNWGIGRELYTAPFIWIKAGNYNASIRNGKPITYDKFVVDEIEYKNKNITRLVIRNNNSNKVVFTYDKTEKTKSNCKTKSDEITKETEQTQTNKESKSELSKTYNTCMKHITALGIQEEITTTLAKIMFKKAITTLSDNEMLSLYDYIRKDPQAVIKWYSEKNRTA